MWLFWQNANFAKRTAFPLVVWPKKGHFRAQAVYIYTCMDGGMRKTLNLKNGPHFPLCCDLKNAIFCTGYVYTYMGSGKPTAARRPTAASHHTLWVVASQQRPEGRLRQAITPYGRWQANSGPKANCGKPSHPIHTCMHTSHMPSTMNML